MRVIILSLLFLLLATSLGAASLTGLTVAINAGHNSAPGPYHLKNGDGVGSYSIIGRTKMRFPGHRLAIQTGRWRGVIREADLVRDIALRLARHCRRLGARVVFSRVEPCTPTPAGRFRNLRARARVVNRSRASVLIDLHANAGQPAGAGYMLFVPVPGKHLQAYRFGRLPKKGSILRKNRKFSASLLLARAVDHQLVGLWKSGGIRPYPGPRIYGAGFKVIGYSRIPGVLLEVGAMDRPPDMNRLVKGGYRERLAIELSRALVRWSAERKRRIKR